MLFHYSPLRLHNNILFLILLTAFLFFMQEYGKTAWLWICWNMSLAFFFCVFGFIFYLLVFWIVAIPYLVLGKTRWPAFLYRTKIQTSENHAPTKNAIPLPRAIARVLYNQFLGTWPVLFLSFAILKRSGYSGHVLIPTWHTILWQVALLLLIEDILFFAAHYFLHMKFLFRHVHRLHHEYKESIAIATHYVHYAEHLFGNLLPVFAGIVIIQPHPFVVMFWILLVVINALHTHGGFAIPGMNYAVHHDWHHYHVHGSFSALGWMDKIFGTDRDLEKLARQSEAISNAPSTVPVSTI